MPLDTPRPAEIVRKGLQNVQRLRDGMAQVAADLEAERQSATTDQAAQTAEKGSPE